MEAGDMVRLNILELLQQRGKTKYWLYKQLGMSYQNVNKMVNNETQSIKLERIETICMLLDCTPNDLFQIDWEQPNSKEK
jgi:putative transcriptional regulator